MAKKTAREGMKKQLVAQLRNKAAAEASGRKRKLVVEEVPGAKHTDAELRAYHARLAKEAGVEPWSKAHTAKAREQAAVLTFPCQWCGEELTPVNRSILQDGRVVHIGCKKAPKHKPDERRDPALAGLPKHKGAKVPKAPKPEPRTHGDVLPCSDYQGRTCLQLARDVNTVSYVDITSLTSFGLHMQYMPVESFDKKYKPIEGYPVVKAVETYLGWAAEHGATQDVLDSLARVVKPKQEAVDMAKKKLAEKKGAAASGSKGSAKKGGGSRTAGGGIGALIREMLGKGTDADAILSAVKKKFPDAKTTKGNIAWYRADMRKKGQKVPEPKGKKAA